MPASWKKFHQMICQGHICAPGVLHIWNLMLICPLLLCVVFNPFYTTHAQDLSTILIEPPNTTNFPNITIDFKLPKTVIPQDGDLTIEQLKVYENGKQIDIAGLTRQYCGVLFTLVINAGRDLDLRDATGTSRYDKLSASLRAWASSRTFAGEDALSLVTNQDIEVRYVRSASEWVMGLKNYQANFRSLEPNLLGLESAIQLVDERVVSLGMDKVLLYITPPPQPDQIESIRALSEEARAENIQVNVWMVGDPLYLNNAQGGALMELAAITGGDFFHYTGEESIPDPEIYLSRLGSFYTLTYESSIRATGTYPLKIEVALNSALISGESQPFYIDVQPPQPIFVSPPSEITCQNTSEKAGAAAAINSECIEWRIMITFPDGHPREVVASRLYVDGAVVAVNEEAPFDTFTWETPPLIDPGEHVVQAEVEDSLGLSARTILTPLNIKRIQPEAASEISVEKIVIISIAILLGAALLLVTIWLLHRLLKSQLFKRFTRKLFAKDTGYDPEHAMVKQHGETILATLIPLHDTSRSIDILHPGNAPRGNQGRVQALIDAEHMEGMHAHLIIEDGRYWLQDLDSVGGIWVNYEYIGTKTVRIHPGDLIHFGSVGFRFTIKKEQESHKADVSIYEPDL